MSTIRKIAALALCFLSIAAGARNTTATQKLVSEYVGKEPLRSGITGLLAVRASGDTLAQVNREVKLIPASNVKLITTGLALERLGADWRFGTTLAYSGFVSDGVLYGDLYIVGGGDPTTGSGQKCAFPVDSTFSMWKSVIKKAGIKSIEGRIIGDGRRFARPTTHPSWQMEDLGYNYGAGVSGLNFFENAQNFRVDPNEEGTAPSVTAMYPITPWMSWYVNAVTGPARSPNTIYCVNSEFGPWGEFFGSFPADRTAGYTLEGSNRFGAYTCAFYFYEYLRFSSIEVSGGYGDISARGLLRTDLLFSDIGKPAIAQDSLKVLGTCYSPALSAIVADANRESDNFFAESMLGTLGLVMSGSSDPSVAIKAEEDLLRGMGLRTANACSLSDGSGLSRKNYVSAEFFVRFLRKMLYAKSSKHYLASLPSPGKGTLKYRMQNAPDDIKSRIVMKSGSMNGVRSFSGYILPAPGEDKSRTIIFSIITNNISGPSATVANIIDDIVLTLAQEP
ncbi:MAG: D-alanyl-D-alanine carboxypeptidase [Bacteroidales bacterium]|nr:D-alanyl-D-alanine carboxypeptidase [Bacteroidales bacterium]